LREGSTCGSVRGGHHLPRDYEWNPVLPDKEWGEAWHQNKGKEKRRETKSWGTQGDTVAVLGIRGETAKGNDCLQKVGCPVKTRGKERQRQQEAWRETKGQIYISNQL